MKILVVGSTGVLGRNTIPRLIEHGHQVRAVIRNQKQAGMLREMGTEAIEGDILDKASLQKAAQGCEAAIHIATAIPKSGSQDWSMNDRIRREGTRNLLDAAEENGVRKYIQQSITFLYGTSGQAIVDESAPLHPTGRIQSAADMEDMVRTSKLDWCILRGGMFYGPGTGRDDEWRESAQQGKLSLHGDGSDLTSLIHVVDMSRAVVASVENAKPKSVYNIVDDQPVSYKKLFSYISAQMEAPAPLEGGPAFLASLGCSNAKARRELRWEPTYPSYLSGLA